ncbi:MAG: nicotinate phosphoribosyltransferase [Candidatus Kaiserbacteria bacterium]|nr:nicotinate phosphoribosyltransferase [Candidatus Kaiserbacteria bacterium]MCB9816638.1 nicotinate phosphoribosyltransferase [Candidatus Nomurabacteria bacterium]
MAARADGLLWQKDAPIIRRIDENDVYKIMMMYFIWTYYPNLKVKFGFTNRTTAVPLSKYVRVDEIREQCEAVAAMRFTDDIIAIYQSWGLFKPEFLSALKELRMDMPLIEKNGDTLRIEAEGNWLSTTPWETQILPIVSELYARGYAAEHDISELDLFNEMDRRLSEKIDLFKRNLYLRIMQFGLRRRVSGPGEEHVTARLLDEVPQVITGVSNMYLANKYGVEAQGTNAHELVMALVALARHIGPNAMCDTLYTILQQWQELYGHKALIILDDAYGSDVFRAELPRKYLESFRGFRHDSGDPIQYGEDTIALYEKARIDPRNKLIIFSDGLNPQRAVDLYQHFAGRIGVAFGMGTNFTFDVGLIKPLSLVMKIQEAAGNPAVKFSNNLAKAVGDPKEIEYYKEVFGYTNTFREDVVY